MWATSNPPKSAKREETTFTHNAGSSTATGVRRLMRPERASFALEQPLRERERERERGGGINVFLVAFPGSLRRKI